MRYLKSILRAAGRLTARAAMCLLFVFLSLALLTACTEKEKEKKVEIEEDETDVLDTIEEYMANIRKAAGEEDEDEDDRGDGNQLDYIGGLGSLSGSGFPPGVK